MNKQLIEKVIKCNNEACPPLIYQNPVLDRNIANTLSKCFVKILKVSGQNINSNLRLSVLENIKRLCQIEPENHFNVDEIFTEILIEVYQKNIEESTKNHSNSTNRILDAFLLRKFECTDMDSVTKSSVNPETIQALNNLDVNHGHMQSLSKEIIHWDINNHKCLNVLKDMWIRYSISDTNPESSLDDISIKMKSEIEIILLTNSYNVIQNKGIDLEVIFTTDNSLLHLVKYSSTSPKCFQICCNILNCIFVTTNFNQQILSFITTFVNYIKIHSSNVSISNLYPNHLCNAVLLLDIDLENFTESTRKYYIEMTLTHLKSLHKASENDLILLLSHFSDWFDIYFEQNI